MLLQVLHVGVALQKPKQLIDDRLQVELLRGQEREALLQVEAHLVAKHADRARTRSILFLYALVEHPVKQVKILFHADIPYI